MEMHIGIQNYFDLLVTSFTGYSRYIINEILHPGWHNYFYWLLALSLAVWFLEIMFPWRKEQSIFRKDFWLDGFYIFFNYFIFAWIGYNALSDVVVKAFNDVLASWFGVNNLVAINIVLLPGWVQLVIMFVVADFIQWNTHRLMHKIPWLWEFHKVHHSVKEMGFAAHLRFHWMETVVYKTIQYIPLAMIGFGINDFFLVHILSIVVGHLNHANLNIRYGILRYVFNNPVMHLWHHAKHLPDGSKGVNFGISLSIWDYLFGTVYIPSRKDDIELGFEHDEVFPIRFFGQIMYPFLKRKKKSSSPA